MSRPRILYVSPCWPNGPSYGTRLRVGQAARALQEIGDLSFVVAGFEVENPEDARTDGAYKVEQFYEFQKAPPRNLWSRLRCSLDARMVNPHGHRVSLVEAEGLRRRFGEYDLIWLHHMRTANVFGNWFWPRSVMDIDDVPSTHMRTLYESSTNWVERQRARWKMAVARQRERLLGERFSVLTVCSEDDRDYLGLSCPVHVIPNGFEAPQSEPVRRPADPPRIGFIGLYNYPPNREGVRWFVDECWPRIRKAVPEARFRLVGKGTEEDYPRGEGAGEGIEGLGFVDDAGAEMATWSAMIVPINRGAGTRVKIAEAFSRKCPVVSTSVGAFGYKARDGNEMFLGDSPEEFADACVRVMRDREGADAMAERAWQKFLDRWTWDAIRPRVWEAAEDCLRRNGIAPGEHR